MMYKNIIPELVTFETELDSIHGFVMCQDFNFFPKVSKKGNFHYRLTEEKKLEVPDNFDYRSEYCVKKEKNWYYDRKIFSWHPSFKYDYENRVFSFNRSYLSLPFSLGGIFTIGEHISNIIDLELFLSGIVILRGISFQKDGQNIGISAPGFNGKTTILKKLLKEGAKYIAEDYLILDLHENKIYPTCPLAKDNFWRRRKICGELKGLLAKNLFLEKPVPLDKLYLTQNFNKQGADADIKNKTMVDFLLINSLYFLNNLFVRSYIYDRGWSNQVFDRIQELKSFSNYKFISIINFNYNFL